MARRVGSPPRSAGGQHAAVAMEHGCQWVTRDDGFAVFGAHGLEWEHLMPTEAPRS